MQPAVTWQKANGQQTVGQQMAQGHLKNGQMLVNSWPMRFSN